MNRGWMCPIAALLVLATSLGSAQAPMMVHEWGTITNRHMADGTPQGRLNRIDASEVLPAFVHRYEPEQTRSNEQASFAKGPRTPGRPDVTMRLETPVIYFHGTSGAATGARFDVRVQLRGGVLNEFYPRAEPSIVLDSGRLDAKFAAKVLRPTDPINLDNYLLGTLAFATRERLTIAKSAPSTLLAEIDRFSAGDYSQPRAAALRQSMKSELTAAGLFDDEAEAMLATWNASYFQKPGLRVFYRVPRAWIDYFLPLELSVPHETTRVLIGRIDLI